MIENATRWLSLKLNSIDRDPHPHELASVALSLETTESVSSEAGFQLLSKYRVESGEFMFWGSDETLDTDPHHLLPNPVLCCQSLAARATALALITYTLRRERLREPIVSWINSRRQGHSGWGDSVTTALVTRALVEHALSQQEADTELGVRLEMMDQARSRVRRRLVTVNRKESGAHVFDEVWSGAGGQVVVTVEGEGRAVVQMSQDHTVSTREELDTSPVTAYQLELRTWNQSNKVYLESCQTWLCPYQTGLSGPSTVIVSLPSSYSINQETIENLAGVAGVQAFNNTIYIYYNYVSLYQIL